MEFSTVVWIVVIVIAPIAAVLFASAFGLLEQLGRGGLSIDSESLPPAPPPHSPASRIERETEIRQMVQARHDRQVARGEAPVDVDAEVKRLLEVEPDPLSGEEQHDVALREEVRQLVLARNERRIARGEPLLHVEAEVERQLRDIGA